MPLPGDTDEEVTLHRKGCVCRHCKMNGTNSAFTPKQVVPRDEWNRLGKPATIESYLAAKEREQPSPPKEDMITIRGSNRAAPGIGTKAKFEIPIAEWERLGRPGTTQSYHEAVEREKNGPPAPGPDTILIRGSVVHRGGDATKLTKEIPRAEWERLGRPRTIDRYHLALEAEKKAVIDAEKKAKTA